MAVHKIDINIPNFCLDIYNQLNALGFVTAPVGVPSILRAAFTSPLISDGYALQISGYGQVYTNRPVIAQIGSYSGSTFTIINDIVGSVNDQTPRSSLSLFYDTDLSWFALLDVNDGWNRFIYVGTSTSGAKVAFGLSSTAVCSGVITIDTTPPAIYGNILAFQQTINKDGYYLEQPVRYINTAGTLKMNGVGEDTIKGLTNIALLHGTLAQWSTDFVLFGSSCLNNSTTSSSLLNTYLKIVFT